MADSEFTPLNQLLTKTVNHYNLSHQVNGALMCHRFRKLAMELWNEAIEEVIQPRSFKDGVLTVAVCDSGWAQQVQFKRVEILKTLGVKDLRIRVETF